MSVKKSKRGRETSAKKKTVLSVLKGSAVGTVLFFLLLLLASRAVLRFDLDSALLTVFAFAVAAVAAFAAGFAAVRPTRKNGVPMGAVSAVPILAVVAVAAAITSGSVGRNMLIAAAIMLVFGAVGGIAAVNFRKKKSRR